MESFRDWGRDCWCAPGKDNTCGKRFSQQFGELDIREDQVIQFSEKPKYAGNYINGGFFVFNRNIFDYLEDRDDCDLEVGPLDQISQKGELMVYKHDKFWACMGYHKGWRIFE